MFKPFYLQVHINLRYLIGFWIIILLAFTVFQHRIVGTIGSTAASRKRICTDFNSIASVGALAGLDNLFVCPNDGISTSICSNLLTGTRNASIIRGALLKWSDIIVYLNVNNGKVRDEVLYYWLGMLTIKSGEGSLELFLIADACEVPIVSTESLLNSTDNSNQTDANCNDLAENITQTINSKYSNVVAHIVRGRIQIDSGYGRLPCKQLYGMNQIYNQFPNKKYYFKIDDDTIIFPSRLLKFLNTLEAVMNSEKEPLYFGTVLNNHRYRILCDELGYNTATETTVYPSHGKLEDNENITSTCYAQGGAGYGLNNIAFRSLALNTSFCTSSKQYETDSEDTYIGYRMFVDFRLVPICGSFRPNDHYADNSITRTVSLHHINIGWVQNHLGKNE